jgi:hypothetical protein
VGTFWTPSAISSVTPKLHSVLPQKRKRESVLRNDLEGPKALRNKLCTDSEDAAKAKSVEQKFSWLNAPNATDAKGRPKDVRPLLTCDPLLATLRFLDCL